MVVYDEYMTNKGEGIPSDLGETAARIYKKEYSELKRKRWTFQNGVVCYLNNMSTKQLMDAWAYLNSTTHYVYCKDEWIHLIREKLKDN